MAKMIFTPVFTPVFFRVGAVGSGEAVEEGCVPVCPGELSGAGVPPGAAAGEGDGEEITPSRSLTVTRKLVLNWP